MSKPTTSRRPAPPPTAGEGSIRLAAEDGTLAAQILAEDRFARLLRAAAGDRFALAHLVAALEGYRLPPAQRDAILRTLADAASPGEPDHEPEPPLP